MKRANGHVTIAGRNWNNGNVVILSPGAICTLGRRFTSPPWP